MLCKEEHTHVYLFDNSVDTCTFNIILYDSTIFMYLYMTILLYNYMTI